MGKRLLALFAEADRLGGLPAKITLARETKITSAQAASIEDDPALCARFEAVVATMRDRRRPETPSERTGSSEVTGEIVLPAARAGEAATLRRYLDTFLDLMSQRSLMLGSVDETVRRVTEASTLALEVARASVWFIDSEGAKITCADLFEHAAAKHSTGTELFARDFPEYFSALRLERTIRANDAHRDPRTACFSTSYLTPLNIGAMLDVPVWLSGSMVGVVCNEHIGSARTWTPDEETFAHLTASFVSLALEHAAR